MEIIFKHTEEAASLAKTQARPGYAVTQHDASMHPLSDDQIREGWRRLAELNVDALRMAAAAIP